MAHDSVDLAEREAARDGGRRRGGAIASAPCSVLVLGRPLDSPGGPNRTSGDPREPAGDNAGRPEMPSPTRFPERGFLISEPRSELGIARLRGRLLRGLESLMPLGSAGTGYKMFSPSQKSSRSTLWRVARIGKRS
jgi:hypothetical protein